MCAERIRIDKWLWVARFAKTRAAAQSLCTSGMIRMGGARITKPGREIRPGDILTLPKGRDIILIRILKNSGKRVSAKDVSELYEILPEEDL